MPRVIKEYEIRRQEFLDTTKAFFFSIGYEKMSVQMLTDKVGVAKGTFYHYFKSKEDLLTQWVLHEMEAPLEQQRRIAEHPEYDALSKLNKIFEHGRDWKVQHLDMILPLMRVLYDDHNIKLRVEMAHQSQHLSQPIFEKIIKQGVREGVFDTPFASELASKLPQISQLFSEDIIRILLRQYDDQNISQVQAQLKIEVWQDLIERMLGAPRNSLSFQKDGFFDEYFSYIEQHKRVLN